MKTYILAFVIALLALSVRAQNTLAGNLTVQQTVKLTGALTPPTLSANADDYAPTNFATATLLRLAGNATRTVTGLAGGAAGRTIYVLNVGEYPLTLSNESTSSTAANRFALGSSDFVLAKGNAIGLWYDTTSSRWRAIGNLSSGGGSSSSGGGSGTVTSVAVVTNNGLSSSVVDPTVQPTITLGLGDITPSSVAATGSVTGSNLSGTNTGDETATTIKTKLGVTTLSGSNTGDQTSVSGNAGTATALQTARNINGVAFDGTSNITVPAAANTLTGTTLATNVVSSSLTSAAGGSFGTAAFTNSTAYDSAGSAAAITLAGLGGVPTARTVNGHALSSNVTVTLSDVGGEAALGNPASNGYVLSSTTGGTRSWVAIPSAPVSSVFGRTGAVTAQSGDYTKSDVGLGNVENTALSTWAGSTNITTLGTVATGTWHGTAIGDTYISSAATWNGKQTAYTNLSTIGALVDGSGWLKNNGAGVFSYSTPTKSDVGLGSVENTALSTWAGSANITTLGTVSTGTWHGSAIADAYIASAATWNGKQDALGFTAVPNTRTVNGHALSADVTVTKSDVGLGSVENTALSTWTGSTNITTLGTVATGTWNATAIADGKIASALTGKTYDGLTLTAAATGFTIAGGTTSKTLTVQGTSTVDDWFNQSVKTTASPTFRGLNLEPIVAALPSTANTFLGSTGGGAGAPFAEYGNLILASRLDGTGRDILFYTGATPTARMVIDRSGNVGVGTTSPGSKLDVAGVVRTTSLNVGAGAGAFLDQGGGSASYLTGGAYYAGYSSDYMFKPVATQAQGILGESGHLSFWSNTGLTVGTNFSPTRRMVINPSGYVGIGTNGPSGGRLVVYDSSQPPIAWGDTQNRGFLSWGPGGEAVVRAATELRLQTNGGVANAAILSTAGAVRLPAYGAGTLVTDSSGNVTASSDARLKNVKGDFKRGLADVLKLTPRIYTWTPESGMNPDDVNVGFIAQEVQPAIPEAVGSAKTRDVEQTDSKTGKKTKTTKREDAEFLSLSDRPIIAALVNAVKELKQENDELKARLEKLEKSK